MPKAQRSGWEETPLGEVAEKNEPKPLRIIKGEGNDPETAHREAGGIVLDIPIRDDDEPGSNIPASDIWRGKRR